MKTILDISLINDISLSEKMLIEVGDEGMSVLVYSENPFSIHSILVVSFEKFEEVYPSFLSILEKVNFASFSSDRIRLFYKFSQSVLVPAEINTHNFQKEILSLTQGSPIGKVVQSDFIETKQIQHLYFVPQSFHDFVFNQLQGKKTIHSNTVLIAQQADQEVLRLIVFYDTITILLQYRQQLQCVRQISYQSPEEVTYHLLNICQQYQLSPEKIPLLISGMIVKDSALFDQLYSYFLNIDFLKLDFVNADADEFASIENHFLSHLIQLATCEL